VRLKSRERGERFPVRGNRGKAFSLRSDYYEGGFSRDTGEPLEKGEFKMRRKVNFDTGRGYI